MYYSSSRLEFIPRVVTPTPTRSLLRSGPTFCSRIIDSSLTGSEPVHDTRLLYFIELYAGPSLILQYPCFILIPAYEVKFGFALAFVFWQYAMV